MSQLILFIVSLFQGDKQSLALFTGIHFDCYQLATNSKGVTSSGKMSGEMIQSTHRYAAFSTLAVECTDRRMVQDLFGQEDDTVGLRENFPASIALRFLLYASTGNWDRRTGL